MSEAATAGVAVIIPVGPGPQETERCRDTVESLLFWEPAVRWLVLVDDNHAPRELSRLVPQSSTEVKVLRSPLAWHQRFTKPDRVAVAVLTALRWVADFTEAELVLELDTDALVIGPLAEKLMSATADPTVGLVGTHDRMCGGESRSFTSWVKHSQDASRLVQIRREMLTGTALRARRYILEARRHGLGWGEHVLASCLAMPGRTVQALRREGCLDNPRVFAGTGLGDDMVLAILVRGCGYRLAGHVGEGETFAAAWIGLPDSPDRLLARGYSVIHSVKNDVRFPEHAIRRYFRRRRFPAGDSEAT
jgi:hypothetical protein